MKFLQYLLEEYVTRFKASGGSCEIYSWPTTKELIKNIKSDVVRFCFLNNTFYVFDASKATHFEVIHVLGRFSYSDMVFWGMGEVRGGKIFVNIQHPDWNSEMYFSKSVNNVDVALEQCKDYFYNYKELIDKYRNTKKE